MAHKFSTGTIPNRSGGEWEVDPKRGANRSILHHFARFGMLSAVDIQLLTGLSLRHVYRTLQLMRADNAKLIRLIPHQARHKGRMGSTLLFYELDKAGLEFNAHRDVPDYEPLSGNSFEHRAMSVQWAVSFYAGICADRKRTLIEWPEIRSRLPRKQSSAILLGKQHVQTDLRPFGYRYGDDMYQFSRGPEIDTGSEQLSFSETKSSAIGNKVFSHSAIMHNRLHTAQLGIPNDFIPFVAPTVARKNSLKNFVAKLVRDGEVSHREASVFGFAVFPSLDSDDRFNENNLLDTRAYTMPYERVGHPDFYFNQ